MTTEETIADLDRRLRAIEEDIKSDVLSYVPGGVNYALASPQSVDPGHKHTENSLSGSLTISDSIVAAEDITAKDAVALVPAMTLDQQQTTQDNERSIGSGAGYEYAGQTITAGATGYMLKFELYLKKVGTPSDNLLITTSKGEIYTLAGSGLTTSYVWYSFQLDGGTYLTAGFDISVHRSGANDANNYYKWGLTINDDGEGAGHGNAYTGGNALAGATYADMANLGSAPNYSDFCFKTYKEDTANPGVLRRCLGTSALLTFNFIGFAPSAITSGNSGTVVRLPTQAGLTIVPGQIYYISDTRGLISSTKGTNVLTVGIAKNTTTLEQLARFDIPKLTWDYISSANGDDLTPITIPSGANVAVIRTWVNTGTTIVKGQLLLFKTNLVSATLQGEVNASSVGGTITWGATTITATKLGDATSITMGVHFFR